jgi:anti-sigma regulatory factor (Ser/Thr protein kinase)
VESRNGAPLALPATLEAAALARRHVRANAVGWPPDRLDVALLLASELVTNAVRYGGGGVTISVVQDDSLMRIEVGDAGNVLPPRPGGHRDLSAGGGRGLQLVEAFASRWGSHRVEPQRHGKVTWFELDRRDHEPDRRPPAGRGNR